MNVDKMIILSNMVKDITAQYAKPKSDAHLEHKRIIAQMKAELDPIVTMLDQMKAEYLQSNRQDARVSIRTTKSIEVDETQLPDEFMMNVPNMELIKQRMRDSEYTEPIEGVKVVYKETVVI